MAEVVALISSQDSGFSTTTPESAIFDTFGKKNFALFVVVPPLGTDSGDTFDGVLKECDTQNFATNETFTIRMTEPDGTAATAITQVDGSMTAGNAALLQKYNLPDVNYYRYIKFDATLVYPTKFLNCRVYISYDIIKRTTI